MKKEVRDGLVQTVVRLRELKAKSDEADGKQGELDGTTWAMKTADVKYLEALEEVAEGFQDPDRLDEEPGRELAQALAAAMCGMFGTEMMPHMLLEDVFPSSAAIHSPHYIVEFVGAALEVWKEVKEQVLA